MQIAAMSYHNNVIDNLVVLLLHVAHCSAISSMSLGRNPADVPLEGR